MPSLRTALVTGGNRGIGLAIVEMLARNNHRVILAARDLVAGRTEAVRLAEQGLHVEAIELDIAFTESIDAALSALRDGDIVVDVLVNNAGVLPDGDLLTLDDANIAASVAVHLTGPLNLVRGLAPTMQARGFGRIINVSSDWGSFAAGLEGPGMYGVTKAALNALTLRLSRDLPATIKCNAMDPGWVRTRMGGSDAPRDPEQAADTALWLATLPDNGPTGGFFRDREAIAW